MILLPTIPFWTFVGSGSPSVILPETTISGTSPTFDGGDADASRRIFYSFHWLYSGGTHRSISSATINGVTAAIRQGGHSGGVSGFGAALLSALVPTTSGSMSASITMSGTISSSRGAPIITYGLSGSTPHDSGSDTSSSISTTVSDNVDVPANGLVIAVYSGSQNATNQVTWTGATQIYDQLIQSTGRASLAVSSGLSEETGRLIRAAKSNESDSGNHMVIETWV